MVPEQGDDAARTCDGRFLVLSALQVFLHQFGRDTDDVLTLPVLDHVERLQRADDVTLCDAGHLAVDGTEASCDLRFKCDDGRCIVNLSPQVYWST